MGEIFLRELISNSSDAIDKLKFQNLSACKNTINNDNLKIWVKFDKVKRTISVIDKGIGMNKSEVIKNLGTIAKSGTKEFIKSLSNIQLKNSQTIGQFGVGFYSGFIVSDKISVETRKIDSLPDEGVIWISDGKGEYTLENIHKLEHGTSVTLYLKETEDEFLNDWNLRRIITKYSDHISFPIIMSKK